MLSDDEEMVFHHVPRLVVSGDGVTILGGRLAPFDFEEFEQLDADWARRSYFENTTPTVWRRSCKERGPALPLDEDRLPYRDLALLIYDALLAVTASSDYPDPRLSIAYHWRHGGTHRLYGPFHRTFLLNQDRAPPLASDVLERIRALAEQWTTAGFRHDQAVFAPLRGLSIMASGELSSATAAVPLIVSLEGYLLSENVAGIARTLSARASRLLGASAPANLNDLLYKAYAWRSDVLHGRPTDLENYAGIGNELRRLAADLVIAMADKLIQSGLGGDKLDVIRATLKV